FSSRRRHTRSKRDWSSDVCSSDLPRLVTCSVCSPELRTTIATSRCSPVAIASKSSTSGARGQRRRTVCDCPAQLAGLGSFTTRRSEERRVGKECECGGVRCHQKQQ